MNKKKAIKYLRDFCLREYGDDTLDINDESKISLMYTEYEELKLEVNVYVSIKEDDPKIWVEYNGKKVYEESYKDKYNDFLEILESMDFDSWANLDQYEEEVEINE